jgi:DNA-binding MltR family transcriptional regulator
VTAILGIGILETELEPMIRQRLQRKDDATWEKLTEDIGPLKSFHSKIVMAYALGIIDETMRENLHIVRRVRNVFAHAKILIDFTEETIKGAAIY